MTRKNSSYIEKLAADIARKAVQDAVRTITGKSKEVEDAPQAVEDAGSTASAEAKNAYIFFNCDAEKAPASMNIRFNDEAYIDSVSGREALLAKIETELAAGKIKASDMEAIRDAILNGTPTDASPLLEYGCIELLIMS